MREVELQDGIKIDIRGLTRKEVKKLKKDGVDLLNPNIESKTAEDQVDTVIELILIKDQIKLFDDMEFRYYRHVYQQIMKETFGSVEEEKNSSAT